MPVRAVPTWPLRALGRGEIGRYIATGNSYTIGSPWVEVDLLGWHGVYRPRVMWNRVRRYARLIFGRWVRFPSVGKDAR